MSKVTVSFYLKKTSRGIHRSVVPIYMRITIDGARTELSTQRTCEPSQWRKGAGRLKGTREEVRSINAYLDLLQFKVFEAQRKLLESGEHATIKAIRDIITGNEKKAVMLLQVFAQHNEQIKQLIGIDFAPGTYQRYVTALEHVTKFVKWKYSVDDITIQKLDYDFVSSYEFWLKTERKCAHNSTMKYISNLKKVVLFCIKKGWLKSDPFVGFATKLREVQRNFLTEGELTAIVTKEFDVPRLDLVRDIFIYSCYTGLAYIDIAKLKRSQIVIGIDGGKWISTQRQKTETPSRIPLLPIPLLIMEKYQDDAKCINEGALLPIFSNQKMNAYLKEIAVTCGITKELTFHCARHTFATTVTLTNGVPIESVSKMLGHKNIRTTQHYAKILDKKVSEDMEVLRMKIAKM